MSIKDMIREAELWQNDRLYRDILAVDNADGITFNDIFVVNYYGITVLLRVNKLDTNRVSVFEIALKKIKQNGEDIMVVCYDRKRNYVKPAKNPLIVVGKNGWTISDFWLETRTNKNGNPEILVPIALYSPLYNKACELGYEYPKTGVLHARKFDRKNNCLVKTCWSAPMKKF